MHARCDLVDRVPRSRCGLLGNSPSGDVAHGAINLTGEVHDRAEESRLGLPGLVLVYLLILFGVQL